MKTIKFFVAALAAVTMLASCSKEDNGGGSKTGTPAKVSLKIVGNAGTRATSEHTVGNADNTISEVTIFFVRADGSFDRAALAVTLPGQVAQLNDIAVTSLLTNVYVVANANAAVAAVPTITNLATLKSKLVDIESAGAITQVAPTLTANGTGSGGKIYQVGSATAVIYTTSGEGATNLTTVAMGFVPARIRVSVTNNMTNPSSITLDNISIVNAVTQSFLFPTSPATTLDATSKTYSWGMADNTFTNVPTGADFSKTYYTETYSTTSTPFFYVFPNKETSYDLLAGGTHPTIVVLKGTFNSNPIFFPVRFDGLDVSDHIESGKAYDLAITLSGDASVGGGGTDDPTVAVVSAFVQVEVTPATWTTVGVTKEFN